MDKNKQIQDLSNEIDSLIEKFRNDLKKSNSNTNIYLERLENSKKFLNWCISKYKISFKGSPDKIYKNQIFYCKLGVNIGSEQGDSKTGNRRPVVILQNNRGNNSSKTTIIAPITTHEGSITEIEEDINGEKVKKTILKYNINGQEKIKKLDYYEVPVEIECIYNKGIKDITGYINLAQIRTISSKRLDKKPIAKINSNTERNIDIGLKKLLDMKI